MSTIFGSNPAFNSYVFSGANTLNQNSINFVGITGPGRITDLNVFWDGDGSSVTGRNILWLGSGAIYIQSSSYSSGVGSESIGGQHLHTTSHNTFFTGVQNVFIGFWRNKPSTSVFSLATSGSDGRAKTTATNAPEALTGTSNFSVAYGVGGAMRAYGHYTAANIYVRRAGAWVAASLEVKRGGVMTTPSIYVRRGGAWVQLQMVPLEGWDDPMEKVVLIDWGNGDWEEGIIRDEEQVTFGNYNPKDKPQTKKILRLGFA